MSFVLQRLKKRQIYVKFFKYEFWLNQITLLEHVVSIDGIFMDLSKLEVMLD